MSPTHYEVLEVIESASAETIRGAYKHLAQRWHPDKNSENRDEAHRRTSALNTAYGVLSDPDARRKYDESLRNERQQKTRQEQDSGQSQKQSRAEADRRAEEMARASAEKERERAQASKRAEASRREAEQRARAEADSIRQTEAETRASAFADSTRKEARDRREQQAIRWGWTVSILTAAITLLWLLAGHGAVASTSFGLIAGLIAGFLTWRIVSGIDDFLESLHRRVLILQVSGWAYFVAGAFLWNRYAKASGLPGLDASGVILDGGFWGGVLAWGFLPGFATLIAGALSYFVWKKRSAWVFYAITAAMLVTLNLNGNITTQQVLAASSAGQPSNTTQPASVVPTTEVEYQRRLGSYERMYPQLNPDGQVFDEALTNRIAARMQWYVQKGLPKPDALTKAIEDHTVRREAGAIALQRAPQDQQNATASAWRPDRGSRPSCPAGMNLSVDQSQCCSSGRTIEHADGSATMYRGQCQPSL